MIWVKGQALKGSKFTVQGLAKYKVAKDLDSA
jgi:hypothetical protein